MAQNFIAEIVSNVEVAEKIFKLTVEAAELAENARAGQFFYRIVGRGTEFLSRRNG